MTSCGHEASRHVPGRYDVTQCTACGVLIVRHQDGTTTVEVTGR